MGMPRFDGSGDAYWWLIQFCQYLETLKIREETWLSWVQYGFDGDAYNWWRSWRETHRNVEFITFEKALLIHFEPEFGVYLQDSELEEQENSSAYKAIEIKNHNSKEESKLLEGARKGSKTELTEGEKEIQDDKSANLEYSLLEKKNLAKEEQFCKNRQMPSSVRNHTAAVEETKSSKQDGAEKNWSAMTMKLWAVASGSIKKPPSKLQEGDFHMLSFSVGIGKGQQWDPRGQLDTSSATRPAHYKQWDPEKLFVRGHLLIHLEDKVKVWGGYC